MFLEDQVWPKRCGHMKGKQVIPLEEQLKQALGLNEAITRGIAFKQAGADAVFIEAPETREEMLDIARWQSRSMRFIQLFVEKEQRWKFWTIDAL